MSKIITLLTFSPTTMTQKWGKPVAMTLPRKATLTTLRFTTLIQVHMWKNEPLTFFCSRTSTSIAKQFSILIDRASKFFAIYLGSDSKCINLIRCRWRLGQNWKRQASASKASRLEKCLIPVPKAEALNRSYRGFCQEGIHEPSRSTQAVWTSVSKKPFMSWRTYTFIYNV